MDAHNLNIIKNIKLAIIHRGGELTNSISDDKINSMFGMKGYVIIPAIRKNDDIRGDAGICFSFVTKNSKAYSASADYERLISLMTQSLPTSLCYELVVVFEGGNDGNLDTKATKIMEKNPNYHIRNVNSLKFVIDVRAHSRSAVHIIATDKEIQEFCLNSKCLSSSFPQIVESDSQVIWLGARPGMIIRIERLCENAGVTTVYRRCVKD